MDTERLNQELNQWLRDAHAMEEQAEQMLTAQANRIKKSVHKIAGIAATASGDQDKLFAGFRKEAGQEAIFGGRLDVFAAYITTVLGLGNQLWRELVFIR